MRNFKNMIFNKYEQHQSILLLPKKYSQTKKTVYYYKNKTLQLINDFYANLFSLRNLEKKYWFLIPTFFIFIALSFNDFYSNTALKSTSSKLSDIYSIIIISVTTLLYFLIHKCNEQSIINKYNKKYSTIFSSIYEVRNDWLVKQLGENYANFETIKKFEDWKKYRDSYPTIYKFNWRKFTYQIDAKPRIIGLIVAFLSMSAVILINLLKPDNPEDVFVQLIINFYFISIFMIFIVMFFYITIFLFDILRLIVNSFFDFIFKNDFSETKYKTFMAFIVNQVEVNDNE